MAWLAAGLAGCEGHDPAAQVEAGRGAASSLVIEDAWSRAILPGAAVAAGYLRIHNFGTRDERLLEVRSPVAGRIQVHEIRQEQGVARMRQRIDSLAVPAGGSALLRPGAEHLMFLDLAPDFGANGRIPATLVFAGAGEREVVFEVRSGVSDPPPHAEPARGGH